MPWTVRDVDRHKKGLTDAQKRRWVKIANSALASCLRKGGSQSACEGSAIRQASGVVGHSIYVQLNSDYTIRTEMHQGRKYIVVPVIMMVEGVHNGSGGPLLHLAEDLGRFPEAWNGIPVTIQHPAEDGHNVSANSPTVIDRERVGRVYNTHMDNGKLKAEAWLDEGRLREVSTIALTAIEQQQTLEVSIGVFTEEENTSGTWNNIQYEAIARNHRPDHLALLPGAKGACSWEDGCGIRLNTKGGNNKPMDKDELLKVMKNLSGEQLTVIPINVSEQGLKELISTIQKKLDVLDSDTRVHYLQEVYEDYFVYEVRGRNEGSSLYKRGYQVNEDESVEFTGEPVAVRRKIEYVTMESFGFSRTKFNNQKKEVKTMSNDKNKSPCEEKVNALINHKLTRFTEDNREWLTAMTPEQLDVLVPNEPEVEEKTDPQINVEQAVEKLKADKFNFSSLLSAEDQASLAYGRKQLKEKREKMIKSIQDNAGKDTWPDDKLNTMDEDILERIYDSTKKEVTDYSLLDGGNGIGETGQKPLYPGGVGIEEESKKRKEEK